MTTTGRRIRRHPWATGWIAVAAMILISSVVLERGSGQGANLLTLGGFGGAGLLVVGAGVLAALRLLFRHARIGKWISSLVGRKDSK